MASDKEPSAPSGHDVRRSAGWDIATAPKNYAVLLGSHFATALLSFTTVWVINKRAGAGAYGGLIAFIAVSQLIQVFLNWSLASLTRFGIEEFVETGHVTRSFWSRTLIFVPNLAVALALSPLWLGPLASAFKIPEEVSWLILVHIVATAAWLHVQYTLQSAKMMRLTGVLLVVERVLVLTLVLGSLYGPGLNATNILWCFIIPPAVMVVVGLVISAKYIGLAKIVDLPQLRTMVRFSLPLIPFTIISYFATSQLDAYFLNNYLTTADLGIYSIATQISGIVVQIPVLANTLLLSMFVSIKAEGDESALKRIFTDLVPSATLLWCVVCAGLAVAGTIAIPIVFGANYWPSVAVLWILMASAGLIFPVLFGLATLSNTYLKTYISMYASAIAALTNVAFDVLLIPRYGMVGCAWATVIASATSLAAFVILLRRERLLPATWIFAATVPTLAAALVLTVSSSFIFAGLASVFSCAVLGVVKSDSLRAATAMLQRRLNA